MSQGLHVTFNLEPRIDQKHKKATGEERWVNVEYISIHVPGDKTNIPHRPVTDEDKQRFSVLYEAWKRGQQDVHDGQPLKTWAAISPAEVNMLAHAHVYTVEQLAAVSDENASRIGPVLALRDKARKHVEQAKIAAPLALMEEKLKAMEAQLAAATAALQQSEDGDADVGPAPRRRGRPPKVHTEGGGIVVTGANANTPDVSGT